MQSSGSSLAKKESENLAPPAASHFPPTLCFNKFGSLAALSPTPIGMQSVVRFQRLHYFLKRILLMTFSLGPFQVGHGEAGEPKWTRRKTNVTASGWRITRPR
jgi:hypothetical protein